MFSLLDRITDFSCRRKIDIAHAYPVDYSRIKIDKGGVRGHYSYLFTEIYNLNYIVSKKSYVLFFLNYRIGFPIYIFIIYFLIYFQHTFFLILQMHVLERVYRTKL